MCTFLFRVGLLGVFLSVAASCTTASKDENGGGSADGTGNDAGDSGDDGGFIPDDLVPEPSVCTTLDTVQDCLVDAFDAREACKADCGPLVGCDLDECEAVCFAGERMARTACYVAAGTQCEQEVEISMCIQQCETAYSECVGMTATDCYDTCDPGFSQCSQGCGVA